MTPAPPRLTSSSSASSTSPGPTMLRSTTTLVGGPLKVAPCTLGRLGSGSGACTITAACCAVFWATRGAEMPWRLRPRPSPSFQPIFSSMRCARVIPLGSMAAPPGGPRPWPAAAAKAGTAGALPGPAAGAAAAAAPAALPPLQDMLGDGIGSV